MLRHNLINIIDVNVIQDVPKLTGYWLSDTGIGYLCPVFKTFLPKTEFSLSITSQKIWMMYMLMMIKSLQVKHQLSWIYFVRLISDFSSPAQIFSCDKQLKKWRCHFVCLSVCLSACLSPYFFSCQLCTLALCTFESLQHLHFSTLAPCNTCNNLG